MAGQIDFAAQYVESTARFIVEIGGVQFSCNEVSAPTLEYDVIEYRTGDVIKDVVDKRAGLKKALTITTKNGVFNGDDLGESWANEFTDDRNYMSANNNRKEVIITQINENMEEILQITLIRAWPSKWTGPGFNATSSEAAIQEIEWQCDDFDIRFL